jgi:hypothetical protein
MVNWFVNLFRCIPARFAEDTKSYLLRVEGTNMDHVIDDTGQLSVRRGASIFLRQAVHEFIPKLLKNEWGMYDQGIISTGASVGIYRLSLTPTQREKLEQGLIATLGNEQPLIHHFTFTVILQPLGDDTEAFREAHHQAEAESRFQQLRTLSLALTDIGDSTRRRTDGFSCEWEGVRPARNQVTRKEAGKTKSYGLAKSVYERYNYGQDQKHGFIKKEAGKSYRYVYDLEELSSIPLKKRDPEGRWERFRSLNRKIALIYLDGNHFGRRREACLSTNNPENALKEFDGAIIENRKSFLNKLFNEFDERFFFINDENDKGEQRCRFELLQWGGDEMLFVVPAWLGFAALQCFFETEFNHNEERLSHAGGLLFCPHNIPIARAQRLVKELAEAAKKTTREEDSYHYLVLESIDYPTQPLDEFHETRYGALGRLLLPAGPVAGWRYHLVGLERFKRKLPRSQVYSHLYKLLTMPLGSCDRAEQNNEFGKTLGEIDKALKEYDLDHAPWEAMFPAYDGDRLRGTNLSLDNKDKLFATLENAERLWQWLHLLELWDYLPPLSDDGIEANAEEGAT